jgi:hypothetical protein
VTSNRPVRRPDADIDSAPDLIPVVRGTSPFHRIHHQARIILIVKLAIVSVFARIQLHLEKGDKPHFTACQLILANSALGVESFYDTAVQRIVSSSNLRLTPQALTTTMPKPSPGTFAFDSTSRCLPRDEILEVHNPSESVKFGLIRAYGSSVLYQVNPLNVGETRRPINLGKTVGEQVMLVMLRAGINCARKCSSEWPARP